MEYVAFSTTLREVIFMMNLLHELEYNDLHIHNITPKRTCRTFEANMSCQKIVTEHKSRPRTKNSYIRLHHFRLFVGKKVITIEYIYNSDQVANTFTKPLSKP